MLRKKTDDSVEIPNTDGAKLNVSSQHALLPNNVHNCPAEFISAEVTKDYRICAHIDY